MPASAIAGVLDQVLEFISSAIEENSQLQTKVAELDTRLGEKVILEKVAKAPVFEDSVMQASLNKLVELRILSQVHMEKLAGQIKKDPNQVFPLLTKVSEALISAPYGFSAGKEEQELAVSYRAKAEALEQKGYHRIATALRDLAKGYEHNAERDAKRGPLN